MHSSDKSKFGEIRGLPLLGPFEPWLMDETEQAKIAGANRGS